MLERANLFLIPLDNERRWYRYHHLFADLLQNRLRVEYAEELPDLYCRAADWYEKQGNFIEAVDLFLKAQEYQRAVDFILLGINTIIKQERYTQSFNHKTILRWIETLPNEFIRNNPRLDIIFAQLSWELGRRDRTTLEAHFQSAQRNYDRLVATNKIKPGDSEFLRIPSDIYVGRSRSTVYRGDFNLAVDLAEKAFALNLSEDIPALVDGYVVLHWAYREAGYPDKALEACEQIISISKPAGYHYGIIEGSLGVGFSYQMQGELDRTAQTYPHVIRYAEQ
jgi:LuxR family maltose regulon positive regulatory protein